MRKEYQILLACARTQLDTESREKIWKPSERRNRLVLPDPGGVAIWRSCPCFPVISGAPCFRTRAGNGPRRASRTAPGPCFPQPLSDRTASQDRQALRIAGHTGAAVRGAGPGGSARRPSCPETFQRSGSPDSKRGHRPFPGASGSHGVSCRDAIGRGSRPLRSSMPTTRSPCSAPTASVLLELQWAPVPWSFCFSHERMNLRDFLICVGGREYSMAVAAA